MSGYSRAAIVLAFIGRRSTRSRWPPQTGGTVAKKMRPHGSCNSS